METANGKTEMVLVSSANTALEPSSFNEALVMAGHLCRSGVLGKAVTKPEAALAVILAGRELGLTAMQSLRSLFIFEGKIGMYADLMLALVKRSTVCKSFRLVESTAKIATYETDRDGEGKTKMSFTIEEAVTAGVAGKDVWKKFAPAMLRARCISALARAVYPDLLMGVYDPDELQERSTSPLSVSSDVVDVESVDTGAAADLAERIEGFKAAIAAAASLDDIKAIRDAVEKDPAREHIKGAIGVLYDAKKKFLAAPKSEVA